MVHNSHMIAAMKTISWPVFTKLIRLCGADQTLTPTYWSSIPMVSLEEGIRCQHVGQAPFYHIKPIWPMPAAGTYPGLAPILLSEYGKDIIIPSGGGMLGHPDGYTAGAQAWQQAIAAAMAGTPDRRLRAQAGEQGPAPRPGEVGLPGAALPPRGCGWRPSSTPSLSRWKADLDAWEERCHVH